MLFDDVWHVHDGHDYSGTGEVSERTGWKVFDLRPADGAPAPDEVDLT